MKSRSILYPLNSDNSISTIQSAQNSLPILPITLKLNETNPQSISLRMAVHIMSLIKTSLSDESMQTSSESDLCAIQTSYQHTLQTRIVLLHQVKKQVKIGSRIVLLTGFFLAILGVLSLPTMVFKAVESKGCMGGHCGKAGFGTSLVSILTGAIGIYASWKQEIRLAKAYSRVVLALIILCCLTSVCLPSLLSRPGQSSSKPSHHPMPSQTAPHPRPNRPSSPQIDRLREIAQANGHKEPRWTRFCHIPKPAHTAFYLIFLFATMTLFLTSIQFRRALERLESTQVAEIEEIRLVV